MEIDIPEHVKKNGPWSISKAGVIAKCSLKYSYQFGPHKLPKPEVTTSADSRIGITVHKALEFALDGVKVKDALMFAIDTNQLVTDEAEKVQSFHEQIQRFVDKIKAFKVKAGVRPQNVLIEYKIGMSDQFKSIKFFDNSGLFRGVVDFMMITAAGYGIVIDHKSGKQKEMSMYEDQCKAYCILALALRPELKGVQTAINFVQTDQLEWNPNVSAEVIRNEYQPWLVQYLTTSCVNLLEAPKPQQGWWCDWCEYKPSCPLFAGK